MNVLKDLIAFLTKEDVLKIAVGLIVSGSALTLTKSFTDHLVLPALNPVMKKLGGEKLDSIQVKILGAKLQIGRFIQTVIRFLILMLTVLLVTRMLKRKR